MHIYRFFHPHHNPRLQRTRIRQQELGELEQAASELRKALERAAVRVGRNPIPHMSPFDFTQIGRAVRYIEGYLQTLCEAHPGDSPKDLQDLIAEREKLIGWDTWTRCVTDHLSQEKERNNGEVATEKENLDAEPSFVDSKDELVASNATETKHSSHGKERIKQKEQDQIAETSLDERGWSDEKKLSA